MNEFALALSIIALLTLSSGLIYKKLKRSILSEPTLALGCGVLMSPYILNVMDIHNWGPYEKTIEIATQLTISMALMATAFRTPKNYLRDNLKLQSIIIFVGMLGMCACSTLLIRLVFGFEWLICFLIGAIITPTDPVTASTIVVGETAKKLLPDRIRHSISFEAGANDGMAYPLVLLPLLLLEKTTETAWEEWFIQSVLWETGGGIVLGGIIGYTAGRLFVKARAANWMSETSLLTFSLTLGLFVLGTLEFINCNGIIGVFVAGFAANLVLTEEEDIEQDEIQEALERVFTIPIFFMFGMLLPWADWYDLGWKAFYIVAATLLFRRLPLFLVLKPLLKKLPSWSDILMVGWFGPIGVAAMFYIAHSLQKVNLEEVWTIGSLIIFGSTIVHGFTGYPLAKWYSRNKGGSN